MNIPDGGFTARIAPSPTGDMHVGTARTAYFNWLAARASKGKFILRIDDTDVARNRQECIDVILKTMEWLGLDYDELHYQSERTALYSAAARVLIKNGAARRLENGAIVLTWLPNMPREWVDDIAGVIRLTDANLAQIDGLVRVRNVKGELECRQCNTVLIRGGEEQGRPTYQFASVVDDMLLGVNYIIRGTDHITNTAKQVAIWSALNQFAGESPAPLPNFAHVGLIFGPDKKKLSKRDGAASMMQYKEQGYTPEAMLNFILRLGWGGKEIPDRPISKREAVELFFRGQMKAAPAGLDPNKLNFFQKHYMKRAA